MTLQQGIWMFVSGTLIFAWGYYRWRDGKREYLRQRERDGDTIMRVGAVLAAMGLLLPAFGHHMLPAKCITAAERFMAAWARGDTAEMARRLDRRAKGLPSVTSRRLTWSSGVALYLEDVPWIRSMDEDVVQSKVYTGTVGMVDTVWVDDERPFDADVFVWVAEDSGRVCTVVALRR